ncbi:MAG: SDR family oxidoreductase [Rhizobiaceae bacterium]|jgi:nucleoside-diphosphate-sugar epimerase|nr:SDR family oxidoreductase [Rhizobiaceae bacterium]
MTRVLITGAAGMIGARLARRLIAGGVIAGRPVTAMLATDVVASDLPGAAFPVIAEAADISDPATAMRLAAFRADVVFHLAAIVSGEAEADLDKGYRINLDGTRQLLDALRHAGVQPRFVFASSIAVFGGPFPDIIPDDFSPQPLTSYGMQKLAGELLVSDLSRRGLIDGVALRLPTICVRPGLPNKAASGFFSGIIREPLAGKTALLPVPDGTVHTHASPRSAIGFLLHAAALDTGKLGPRRAVTLPGVAVSVGEQIEALRRVAGDAAVARITRAPDAMVARIVSGWPTRFEARRARALGFEAENDFDAIIRAHLEDEHGGVVPA